ncbi:TIGR00366 family protein [Brevibacillus humidisoli]|uniref:YfcC family protein n=1 Tax=Brevibacillus humidisoli TaxID=2895522 RepID=UPI001E3AF678|nr:TIGR00366 family protein [Brevibacillus humidisoli]UFJ39639.1 TIGR00366 family protein [Brevibacillus humidisoli]
MIKVKFPSSVSLLMIVILFCTLLTYVVPAGEFDRMEDPRTGKTVVVSGSYHAVESNPVGLWDMLSSIFYGIIKASEIISFIFIIGGVFHIVIKSGAINTLLARLIQRFSGKESMFILVVMSAFAIGGATFGMSEETLPFVAILITMCAALGYDRVTAVAIVLLGVYAGYSAGPLNPFSTGIAQNLVELPLFSGVGLRTVFMIGAVAIAAHHLIRYASRVKKDPKQSVIYGMETNLNDNEELDTTLTKQHKIVLTILGISLIGLIFGIIKLGWYFAELSALFILMGFVIGLILYKGDFNRVTDQFMDGAREMTTAAILVGISRGVLVVMEQGNILDTIVYGLSIPLQEWSPIIAAWGMYFITGIFNFIMPSSSGQAVVVMPILGPLSDLIQLNRQVAVLAFQAGDGFWNLITPTHSVLMASLGIAGIPFNKWFRFMVPLMVKWGIWVMLVIAFAVVIDWGPF